MIMSCNMFFQVLSVIPFFSQTVVSFRATYRISQPKPKKQKNPPRKKLFYFRKLNFFTLKKLNKTFKIFFAPKNVIKFPNTVSEAILDTLKKLILKKAHFQNCSHKKNAFSKLLPQNFISFIYSSWGSSEKEKSLKLSWICLTTINIFKLV